MRRAGYLSACGILVMLMGILAACGGATPVESPASSTPASVPPAVSSSPAPATSPSGTAAGYDPSTGELTVITKEYSFDAPESIPAGVTTLRVINQGNADHNALLISVAEGHTLAEAASLPLEGPTPSWITSWGGPAAAPGETATSTVKLAEGKYALISHGHSDPGVPDFKKGMIKEIEVTAAGTAMIAEPASTVTVTMKDYGFDISPALTAGTHTLRVENAGPQPHFMMVGRLADGKTIDDFFAFFQEGGMQGEPPVDLIGHTGTTSPGKTEWDTMDFTPGNYLLVCFEPDVNDGRPHVEHGMIQQISVQ